MNDKPYPGVWKYEFSVDSPWSLILSLVKRDFIRENKDEELECLKIYDVNYLLKQKNKKTKSSKKDALASLLETYSVKEIWDELGKRYFMLTEKGK